MYRVSREWWEKEYGVPPLRTEGELFPEEQLALGRVVYLMTDELTHRITITRVADERAGTGTDG